MKVIWAPWRLDYIREVSKSGSPKECFICRAINGENDRENLVVYRGGKSIAILNRFPYNTAHVMVCPLRHTGDFMELDGEEILEMNNLIKKVMSAILKVYNPAGFNIGLNLGKPSGGSVDYHIHYHVVPRWVGDTNFMPIIGGVKVIPQSLEDTYDALKSAWETDD